MSKSPIKAGMGFQKSFHNILKSHQHRCPVRIFELTSIHRVYGCESLPDIPIRLFCLCQAKLRQFEQTYTPTFEFWKCSTPVLWNHDGFDGAL
jgi:hypothetical protein